MNDGLMIANSTLVSGSLLKAQIASSTSFFASLFGPSWTVASRCQSSSVNSLPRWTGCGLWGVIVPVDDVTTTRLTPAVRAAPSTVLIPATVGSTIWFCGFVGVAKYGDADKPEFKEKKDAKLGISDAAGFEKWLDGEIESSVKDVRVKG